MKERIKKVFPNAYSQWLELRKELYLRKIKNMSEAKQVQHIKDVYYTCIGRELNIDNPKAYTEKIQWSKFYDKDPRKALLADKYLAKQYAEEKIGEKYVIKLLGVWDHFDDIVFDKLPNSFVLKTNHYSGTNIIVHNKDQINKRELRKNFRKWLEMDCAYNSMELHYKDIHPRIIAEELIGDKKDRLIDYSFFCFDGEPFCFFGSDHVLHARNFYDMNGNLLNWKYNDGTVIAPNVNMVPKNLQEMIDIAKKLSEGLQQVRVDLYLCNGRIYFGEMTFTSFSGLCKFMPDDVDYLLGEKWNHRSAT